MEGSEQEPVATTITTMTTVNQEPKEHENIVVPSSKTPVVDLSSDSDSDAESDDVADKEGREFFNSIIRKVNKKRDFMATSINASDDDHQVAETEGGGPLKKRVVAPVGFLAPLPQPVETTPMQVVEASKTGGGCRQFWKAGDYEGFSSSLDWDSATGGMDHVRVHPKFLHSNATSHKWALGAFAELLDNALDETSNGATYVNVDMLQSKKDGSRMLLIEDNGGGMDPDKMRQCMSLGYSAKSKLANTIGQYGNGFKTSTMRLGADVIVFSRCCGEDGKSFTQSIGLLSYTFLRSTGKEDIVVPILDYEREGREWKKLMRSKFDDWSRNANTIAQWSPFSSEEELLKQFNLMNNHGTRIIIYNLWQDDQGLLELNFDADEHDIQIRGVNRDEKKIQMASQYPNSRHFLTYRHSLRSYASILYLRLPPGFRIILRGEDVVHHNIVNDMMLSEEVTYRPQPGTDGITKDLNMVAVVTIGFVKDAQYHIDVQGFNVYHKNRLIKPFWRIWNAAGSNGRGVIGVLEANFVEPAHDKQGFERTIVLSRLEARLLQMQKTYWSKCCHKIGYAPSNKKHIQLEGGETSVDCLRRPSHYKSKSTLPTSKMPFSDSEMLLSHSNRRTGRKETECSLKKVDVHSGNGNISGKMGHGMKKATIRSGKISDISETSSSSSDADGDGNSMHENQANGSSKSSKLKGIDVDSNDHSSSSSISQTVTRLRKEINELRGSLKKKEDVERNLQSVLQAERGRCKSLDIQLQEAERKMEEMNKEQESLIDIFSEERERRDAQEENLIKKLKEASATIQELVEKVRWLEKK